MEKQWLVWARELQSISQSGLTYCKNDYDLVRYREIEKLSREIIEKHTEVSHEVIKDYYIREEGYLTPKVDVRGGVIVENKILLVREKVDGRWSLPGGWADVNRTPQENVIKEAFEEAKSRTNTALAEQNTGLVLSNVFARLYTLRNQIVHGGTVYNSPYTRAQLRDGCAILKQCIPLILQIMQENHTLPDWGKPFYPHVDAP